MLQPNWGLYSLKCDCNVNQPYLAIESQLCELITTINIMTQRADTLGLSERLFKLLTQLNYQKELQWAQQRGYQDSNGIVVNTGKCSQH